MKKLMSLIVCFAISATALGADQSTMQAPDVARIKAEIVKHGSGEKARVLITTRDKRQLRGYIKEADESSFVIVPKGALQAETLSYADVLKVKGPGMSTGAKVGIGLAAFAAGVGIFAGVVLAKCHGYC